MGVEVYQSKRKEEDGTDKAVKLASIGIGIAGVAQKSGNSDAMSRRLEELKGQQGAVAPDGGYDFAGADDKEFDTNFDRRASASRGNRMMR